MTSKDAGKGPIIRAPEHLFAGFEGASEDRKKKLRRLAMEWLLAQPKTIKGATYVIPHPDTGEEMHVTPPMMQ